ncbi:MAG: YebC/PmpR family DNA-binding transcriptional regulator [Clostridia bacterium]|nr:YebC/PmpR family DNA-binding transcriptional regulator [Clostridia bacterium]
MSGHSKWANIKHRKGKADAVRGKVFTKLGREIAVAVREGGPDPASNGKLRDIVAKAKANNMPNDNIARSIKKASGELGTVSYEEIVYEGYAAGGIAVIVECLTDNRNRTASDVRHYFDKYGGNLGTSGAVSWVFDRKGLLVIERKPAMDDEAAMLLALEAGASDMEPLTDAFEVYTEVADFSAVRDALEASGQVFLSAELTRVPHNTVDIFDAETLTKIGKMLDALDDMDDVQNIYHNANIPDDEADE